jgi:hypothetical protein
LKGCRDTERRGAYGVWSVVKACPGPLASVEWDRKPVDIGVDPAASLRLDRGRWERDGATFVERDDGEGEAPGLATGTVAAEGARQPIGALDYGEEATCLLVPGVDPERLPVTVAVLEALEGAGVLDLEADLLDLADGASVPTLE